MNKTVNLKKPIMECLEVTDVLFFSPNFLENSTLSSSIARKKCFSDKGQSCFLKRGWRFSKRFFKNATGSFLKSRKQFFRSRLLNERGFDDETLSANGVVCENGFHCLLERIFVYHFLKTKSGKTWKWKTESGGQNVNAQNLSGKRIGGL